MGRFTASVIGAKPLARRWFRAASQLDRLLRDELLALGEDSELIFAAHALRKTGRLARGIKAIPAGSGVIVRADARDPETGYDYVGVTRFGHAGPIRVKRAKALRFTIGGALMFRKSTRGFHPAGDWAQKAMPQIEREVGQAEKRLARRVEAVLA